MIRPYTVDDVDYIVDSHYELYHQEFHYDLTFKEFIQERVNGFVSRDSQEENIWVIDIHGARKGSISINKVDSETAQLGLFLVDPKLRGEGYGQRLIETAIHFCERTNYKRIMLVTNQELRGARVIYKKQGFKLIEEWSGLHSNKEMIEERWILELV
ncbi:GNAT family N-acetyltransferase [Alkalicoccobacillus murimartini]|uniref:GNAT superfamily N-acetyltransferase n=1 Tax=Alkalicoccobacillus murimartini TaxID=171685 RepID=A0ABT9YLG1_9BACI|nr:GNAT family N-acetyltransferase [Alkalicoccobacillus murimartini]MDQ0208714.1 GNAT superfamily N-acetyltransferase [Alkalicoccobacillus murimartini]